MTDSELLSTAEIPYAFTTTCDCKQCSPPAYLKEEEKQRHLKRLPRWIDILQKLGSLQVVAGKKGPKYVFEYKSKTYECHANKQNCLYQALLMLMKTLGWTPLVDILKELDELGIEISPCVEKVINVKTDVPAELPFCNKIPYNLDPKCWCVTHYSGMMCGSCTAKIDPLFIFSCKCKKCQDTALLDGWLTALKKIGILQTRKDFYSRRKYVFIFSDSDNMPTNLIGSPCLYEALTYAFKFVGYDHLRSYMHKLSERKRV